MNNSRAFFNLSKSSYVHYIIIFLIEICFRWIPPFGAMSEGGMAVLGVFVGTIYGWLALSNMGITSLIGIIMMGTTFMFPGGPTESFVAAIGNTNTLRVLACFGVAGLMNLSGTSTYLAKKIVGSKLGRKSPVLLCALFMIAAIIIGPFVSFATLILLWDMWRAVCDTLKAPSSYLKYGIGCIMIAFCLANQCFPFVPMVVTLDGMWTGSTGLPPAPFLNFVVYMLVMAIIVCILWLLIGRRMLKIDLPDTKDVHIEKDKATPYQIYCIICIIVYAVLLCIAGMNVGPASAVLASWGLIGFSIMMLIITLILAPAGSPKSFHEIMSKSLNWDLLATMGMVMLLSSTVGSEEVGLGATLAGALSGLNSLGPVAFAIIIMIIPTVLTQYLNNLTMGVIFIPICYTLGHAQGLNVVALNCCIYMLTSVALASPSGSLGSAMYYECEEIDKPTGYKSGWLFTILCIIVAIICFFALGNVFFPNGKV